MILAAIFELLLITILANASFPQDNKPLGDVARDARAAKSSAPKSGHVITNEEVPDRKGGEQASQLSPKKQAFCDFLRRRKDTAAEQGCALMSVDMGPEYEETTARYVELAVEGLFSDFAALRRSTRRAHIFRTASSSVSSI